MIESRRDFGVKWLEAEQSLEETRVESKCFDGVLRKREKNQWDFEGTRASNLNITASAGLIGLSHINEHERTY